MAGTIMAMTYGDAEDGGVVLAADSLVTAYDEENALHILSEEYVKILNLSEKTFACVAGMEADVEYVYFCVHDILSEWRRMLNRSLSVREVAVSVSFVLAQEMEKGIHCIVGGWDADGGPQIYFVARGGGLSANLKYKYAGSGSAFFMSDEFDSVLNSGCSKEETKQHLLKFLNMAVTHDPCSGGQLYTVIIDKTAVVKEVLSKSGEVIQEWGRM